MEEILRSTEETGLARNTKNGTSHSKTTKDSETSITFSREDQWTSFSEPGKFPLVLDPVVAGSILTRVLIDGGSGLNLIFMSTISKTGLNISDKLKQARRPSMALCRGMLLSQLEL